MDQLLARAGSQAVTFAIRSGITFASGYAVRTVTKFLDKIPESEKKKILDKRTKIRIKTDILGQAMDLIRLAAVRGNTSLEPSLELIEAVTSEIERFETKMSSITETLSSLNEKESVIEVNRCMDNLLTQLDEAIPLLQLSIATSGTTMKTSLSPSVSPGRLLQASSLVAKANESKSPCNVGPVFDLVYYSVFYNPSRLKYIDHEDNKKVDVAKDDDLLAISWKEEYSRASVRIISNNKSSFQYSLEIREDHNDGRYHDEKPKVVVYDVKSIMRMFFSASGKLLKLESRSAPVLMFKLVDKDENEEWIALGQVGVGEFDDSDSEEDESEDEAPAPQEDKHLSLSLLEYLLRLCALQQRDQTSIFETSDEKLALYLQDENAKNTIYETSRQKRDRLLDEANTNNAIDLDSNMNRLKNLDLQS
ncbi:hypothetical protein PGUG_05596 [Meyerozyma guilliermondii ATCC 6260]|uniref:Ran-specific GTPase-activating protein 30 n=1 Tax=Meyerozyma guilliermondii (strain ATCC 6260 / CBS 566 / DSM 6381 / JCM 1539 / NBRC 10279 / NRRL Y-324) TaxID=294746 RepID=A5DQP5_PICGU|nr:uncharacterized protein PGUG_05596 [Meyerozyma guilliermondii ATCC 6260]EDK41498.2 hypothetical protein PGUG_05596 [Meyerozyma guilliermondii ATCC 6260]